MAGIRLSPGSRCNCLRTASAGILDRPGSVTPSTNTRSRSVAVRAVPGLRTWLLSMVGTVTTAFCSWAFFVRQWSGRSRRRTATRTGVRSSFTGMEGWSPRSGWCQLKVPMTVGQRIQPGIVRRR